MTNKSVKSLNDLYQYFDSLLNQDDDDILFASSYLRGFIAVEAVPFGDDEQLLTPQLFEAIDLKLNQAKAELTPQDRVHVLNFWHEISCYFNH